MQLPIEISEAVIDQAREDSASLCNLSLTCATFLPRSRYHLFSRIIIRGVKRMDSYRDFFNAHPWLLPLINKVTVSTKIPEYYSKKNIRVLDRVPVYLLTHLPNLRVWSMDVVTSEWEASLSLHRSLLAVYRIYSGCIQILNLSGIRFRSFLDLTGLLASFTNIHTLTCSYIQFRKGAAFNLSLYIERAGLRGSRPLQISTLMIGAGIDTRVQEYMLFYYGSVLSSLSLAISPLDEFERLEECIKWLSRLSSLTLVFRQRASDISHSDAEQVERFSGGIRFATRFLQHVERASLTDVRVKFETNPIAALGSLLSGPNAPLEAINSLEKALLTFPDSRVLVRDGERYYRAGRAALWSPIIKLTFPMLDGLGGLHINFMHTKTDCSYPPGHEDEITSLVISHNSRWVVTASTDDTIIIWDTSSGAVVHEWLAHQHGVNALALSPDSQQLILSAGSGPTAIVWALHDGFQRVNALEGHTATVRDCAWSPDGALIASASTDNTVRIWDGRTFQQRDVFSDLPEPQNLQFSPDSRHLAWISGYRTEFPSCCIWRPLMGDQPKRLQVPSHRDYSEVELLAFSFHPDSSRIATAHGDCNDRQVHNASFVRIWDVVTGDNVAVLVGPSERRMTGVSFSRADGGRTLLSTSDEGFVRIWDVESRRELVEFEDESANFVSPSESSESDADSQSASSSGESGASADSAGSWESGESEFEEQMEVDEDHSEHVSSAGSRDSDAESGEPLFMESLGEVDESVWISIACLSPDGKLIATATGRGVVRLWRMDGYVSCVATFREHRERSVERIAFSPDGEFLVFGGDAGIVHIRRISNFI